MSLNESIVEDAALTWSRELIYAVRHGPQLAPSEPAAAYQTFVATVCNSQASIEMSYKDENIWLTQKMMAALNGVSLSLPSANA